MAVNPYQWIHSLYTTEIRTLYARKLVWQKNGGDATKSLQPHVYEASALAYRGLALQNQNQSILVSGESGAGKTETVKICMSHLALVQAGPNASGSASPVVERVVDSNPLLEAFGNAKTRRNDNSSRFGKYIQLQFEGYSRPMTVGEADQFEARKLVGSSSQVHLLEKSRVVRHDDQERTFHIFYQLLSSPDAVKSKFWKNLKGKGTQSFKYVGVSGTTSIEGKLDAEHFQDTLKSLSLVGIHGNKLQTLMTTICTVLQLGNVGFTGCKDKSQVSTPKELKDLADLMGVSDEVLTNAFTERTMTTRTDSYKVPLNVEFAQESCDALAKELYHKAFLWLVNQINEATKADVSNSAGQKFRIIGLLDIFGFESFETNGFEQLCINYANEKLQQKFTHDIFREVQAEYTFEGLALRDICYDDNSHVVELIESRMGLLAMLNEECVRPQGSDREFVYKAISENRGSPALVIKNQYDAFEFGIRHYCGEVIYNANGFVNKNNDTLATDLLACVSQSTNEIIGSQESAAQKVKRGSNVVASTVWTKYRDGLSSLMSDLKETQSRYIRCIKPNEEKKPLVMEHALALDQLRSAGVVAAITISRSAFPNRLEHLQVWDRFRGLFPKKAERASNKTQSAMMQNIETVLSSALAHMEFQTNGRTAKAFAIGKTRTYFRAGALEFLESERFKGMEPAATKLQAGARGFLVRRQIIKQSTARDNAAFKIQVLVRRKFAKAQELQSNKSKKVESLRRMKAAREKRKQNKAAATIQAVFRGALQRPKYRAALKDQKEVGGIKEQIELLKAKLAKSEEERVAAVKEAEDRVTKAMASMEDEGMDSAELQHISLKARLEESDKVLDFLRRERKRLMGLVKTHKGRCDRIVEQHKAFEEANQEVRSRMVEVEKIMDVLEGNKATLAQNKEIYVNQLKAYRKEIQKGQAYKQNEEDVRGVYQDAVERIVALVQEECKNDDLVEDIYLLAMECGEFTEDKASDAKLKGLEDDLDDLDDLEDLSDTEMESLED
jgi:myosin heavy subunit